MSEQKNKWLAATCEFNAGEELQFYFQCREKVGLVTHEVTTLTKMRFKNPQDALKEYDKLTPAQQNKVWFIEERINKAVHSIREVETDPEYTNEFHNTNFRHSLQIEKIGWKPLWK